MQGQFVLIISRDRTVQKVVKECLSANGIPAKTCITIRDPHTEIHEFHPLRPRLVILDDGIGQTVGIELIRLLHRRTPETLIIYLATHHTFVLERSVRQLGVLYYAEKPLDAAVLRRLTKAAMFSDHLKRHQPSITKLV